MAADSITFLVSLAVLMDLLRAQMVVFRSHFFSNKFMTKLKRPVSTSLCFPIDLLLGLFFLLELLSSHFFFKALLLIPISTALRNLALFSGCINGKDRERLGRGMRYVLRD